MPPSSSAVNTDLSPMNSASFLKMAHGDLVGLRVLAFDYFKDTRKRMAGWVTLIESKNFKQLRDELHRCKGGASLFGLERIVAMIGSSESKSSLEQKGFDLARFEEELKAAENAILEMKD